MKFKLYGDFLAPIHPFQERMAKWAMEIERKMVKILWPCPSCGKGPAKIESCHVHSQIRHYLSSCRFCEEFWTNAIEFDGLEIKSKITISTKTVTTS